jgi:hypothetical protein
MEYFAGTNHLQVNEYKGFTSKIPGGVPPRRAEDATTKEERVMYGATKALSKERALSRQRL